MEYSYDWQDMERRQDEWYQYGDMKHDEEKIEKAAKQDLREYRRTHKPSLRQLQHWQNECGCECSGPCACWVEPDGRCGNGYPSWLLYLGLI